MLGLWNLKKLLQRLILWLLYCVRLVLGKSFVKMNFRLFSQLAATDNVLRLLGANVGARTHIYADICLYNLDHWSCKNLNIGSNVTIGARCLFDLASKITIEDDVSLAAQVCFVTHLDVGSGTLKEQISRRQGAIVVKKGAWIGVNTTILHGVTIGEYAMVGAMSLVNRDVPAHCLAVGIPCKVVKHLKGPTGSDGQLRAVAAGGEEELRESVD